MKDLDKYSKNPRTVTARNKRWAKKGGEVRDEPVKPANGLLHNRLLDFGTGAATSTPPVKEVHYPPDSKRRTKKEPKAPFIDKTPDLDFTAEPETVEPVQVSSAAASKSDKYRTTIFLTAQQREALKVMSAKTGNAVACLIRNAIDTLLKESL
jgi:hypothetical protein